MIKWVSALPLSSIIICLQQHNKVGIRKYTLNNPRHISLPAPLNTDPDTTLFPLPSPSPHNTALTPNPIPYSKSSTYALACAFTSVPPPRWYTASSPLHDPHRCSISAPQPARYGRHPRHAMQQKRRAKTLYLISMDPINHFNSLSSLNILPNNPSHPRQFL